jgi:hypothetical protein
VGSAIPLGTIDLTASRATLLLAHARTQELNQKRLENFLAASNSPNLDISRRLAGSPSPAPRVTHRHRSPSKNGTSGADTPRDLNARVKILELYTLHVLLRNNEWEYAREFISLSSVLDEERREAFLQALQSLQEEQQETERKEREDRERQEDQLRRHLEEARKFREENEERERRRLEEELSRREGSEVDYGIEQTPSVAGSSKGQHVKANSAQPNQPARHLSPTSRKSAPTSKGKSVATPSIGAQATIIVNRLRVMIEQWTATFRTNPMLLMRLIAFILGLVIMFGRRSIRERIQRVLGKSWDKVRATAGMGVKVSYI